MPNSPSQMAQVHFPRTRHHNKRRRRWVDVKGRTSNGRRDPKCLQPGALVWFEKTQEPPVKVLPGPGWRPMKQLAVRVYFLRCGGLPEDWSITGILSLVSCK
ncbi:e3 ubiquitin-protein ligase RNF13 [Trichonephila clavipes]|nr:e3 ubiquitin-protein ligase RNF13 [Trichonephila clavipes]